MIRIQVAGRKILPKGEKKDAENILPSLRILSCFYPRAGQA
jgi:hypothetical protein